MKALKFVPLLFQAMILLACGQTPVFSQITGQSRIRLVPQDSIVVAAERTGTYFPLLTGKSIGIVCNHSSLIHGTHLIDTLRASGLNVIRIFAPEHGFRGDAAAGEEFGNSADAKTGIPVVSLYAEKKKPSPGDLAGIDIMVFDIQDVGVRFYTYISTLALVMEACAGQGIPLLVLDRPNPNAFYTDGPVLDTALRSFVGMHPVPIVYGLTIGEYAGMVNGEGWLKNGTRCELTVIPMEKWDRSMIVRLPVKPSPNLPNWQAIYLYPFICLFEGTVISVGRGTDMPFQVIGHPNMLWGSFGFTPRSIPGVSEKPPYQDQHCYGTDLSGYAENYDQTADPFTLFYLLNAYNNMFLGDAFFSSYFEKLAGTRSLRNQIKNGISEAAIRESWATGLDAYKKIRAKYLLYPDNQ